MKKYAIAALLIAGLATPALAAEFYVAQSTSNHKCSIVSQAARRQGLTLSARTATRREPRPKLP